MEQMHIQPTETGAGLAHNAATEEQLWSYLVQLASALRAVHSAGLACRSASLTASKVSDFVLWNCPGCNWRTSCERWPDRVVNG